MRKSVKQSKDKEGKKRYQKKEKISYENFSSTDNYSMR